jgi:PLP dependent protein
VKACFSLSNKNFQGKCARLSARSWLRFGDGRAKARSICGTGKARARWQGWPPKAFAYRPLIDTNGGGYGRRSIKTMTETSADPRTRLAGVLDRIDAAARSAGRDPASVRLVAITKTYGAEAIAPVLEAGHRTFGENRVQEARAKWSALRERYPGIELHLVGALQSNKAREAVQTFDAIHSIDREKIAEAVAEEMARQRKALQLFIQVNTGEEPQKAGVAPREAGRLLRFCRDDLKLAIAGLMCIPPHDEEPGVHFAFLAKLAAELGLAGLSMGMSADFETAVTFGATHVRVGSDIFGQRTPAPAPR